MVRMGSTESVLTSLRNLAVLSREVSDKVVVDFFSAETFRADEKWSQEFKIRESAFLSRGKIHSRHAPLHVGMSD